MNILFIGLDYHTYTRSIIAEMEALGATVKYVDIQPRSLADKFIRTAARSSYERSVERGHAQSVADARGISYDKVVFLQAHQFSLGNLQALRDQQKRAEFVLYNWDALSNHDYRRHAPFFDRVLTFDRVDALNHGYGYLPLFCQRSMQGLRRDREEPRSIFTVGNIVKPARYFAIKQFRQFCQDHGLVFRTHLKISPVVVWHLARERAIPTGVSFRAIGEERFKDMIECSQGVFDFANHAQSGQTMRMMENLCTGKKIITNNVWVKQEPFYSPDRIHVFDGTDFSGVPDFLDVPLAEPEQQFADYHIQSFTSKLLGMTPIAPIKAGA